MGNDFTKISNETFSILSNAAVIAVNQDPLGLSAARRWLYDTDDVDEFGKGSIQMWSGTLVSTTGGDWSDYVVVLINGNNNTATLNATLADIFVDSGTGGTAPQAGMSWEVRDLWANRLTDGDAQVIINAAESAVENGTKIEGGSINGTSKLYNATRTSYAEGLDAKNEMLLGKVTTTVQPQGTITAKIDRHGTAMFRLRVVLTDGKTEL